MQPLSSLEMLGPIKSLKLGDLKIVAHEVEPGQMFVIASGGSPVDRGLFYKPFCDQLKTAGYQLITWHLPGPHDDPPIEKEANDAQPGWPGWSGDYLTWPGVMQKAKRLLDGGQVQIHRNGYNNVVGEVQGDHGTYEVEFMRDDPNSRALTQIHCDCPWMQWANQPRMRQFKKFQMRPCAHSLAAYWASLGTPLDEDTPDDYQPTPGQMGPQPSGGGAAEYQGEMPDQPDIPPSNAVIPQQEPLPPYQPGSSPAGFAAPPNAVSVPGARPASPQNPINWPSAFSKVKTSGATLPQEMRTWDNMSHRHDAEVVHSFPDQWTIQRHNTAGSAALSGAFMHNCWQGLYGDGPNKEWPFTFDPTNYMTMHDEHGIPRAAFYEQGTVNKIRQNGGPRWQIAEPLGARNRKLSPEMIDRLDGYATTNNIRFPESVKDQYTDYDQSLRDTFNQLRPQEDEWGIREPGLYPMSKVAVDNSDYDWDDYDGEVYKPGVCRWCGSRDNVDPRELLCQPCIEKSDVALEGGSFKDYGVVEDARRKLDNWNGFTAKVAADEQEYQNGSVVQLNKPTYGILEGPQDHPDTGTYREIPQNSHGEIIDYDPGSGYMSAIFPLHDTGAKEPWMSKLYLHESEVRPSYLKPPGTFIRRTR